MSMLHTIARGSVTHMYNGMRPVARALRKRASRCRAVFHLSKRSPWRNNEGGQSGPPKDEFHRERKLCASVTPTWTRRKVKRRRAKMQGEYYGRCDRGRCDTKRARITFRLLKDPRSVWSSRFLYEWLTWSKWSRREEMMFLENSLSLSLSVIRCINVRISQVEGYERNVSCQ